MQNDTWTSEWPTEPGNYWFHGWAHKVSYKNEPKTHFVTAHKTGDEILMFIADGGFFYKHDGAKGLWLPAEVPELSEFNVE